MAPGPAAAEVLESPDLLGIVDRHLDHRHAAASLGALAALCRPVRATLLEVLRRRLGCPTLWDAWLCHCVGRRVLWIETLGTELHRSVHVSFSMRSAVNNSAWALAQGTRWNGSGKVTLLEACDGLRSAAVCLKGLDRDRCALVPGIDAEDCVRLVRMGLRERELFEMGHYVFNVYRNFTQADLDAALARFDRELMRVPAVPYMHLRDEQLPRLCGLEWGCRTWKAKNQRKHTTPEMVAAAERLETAVGSLQAVLLNAATVDKGVWDEACALRRDGESDLYQLRRVQEARQNLRKATAAMGPLQKRASALAGALAAAVAAPVAPQAGVKWTELRATRAALEERAETARRARA